MTHQEAKRMLERNDDEPMSEEEALMVMAEADAMGLPADPAWVPGEESIALLMLEM